MILESHQLLDDDIEKVRKRVRMFMYRVYWLRSQLEKPGPDVDVFKKLSADLKSGGTVPVYLPSSQNALTRSMLRPPDPGPDCRATVSYGQRNGKTSVDAVFEVPEEIIDDANDIAYGLSPAYLKLLQSDFERAAASDSRAKPDSVRLAEIGSRVRYARMFIIPAGLGVAFLGEIIMSILRDALHLISQAQVDSFLGRWGINLFLIIGGLIGALLCWVFSRAERRQYNKILDNTSQVQTQKN